MWLPLLITMAVASLPVEGNAPSIGEAPLGAGCGTVIEEQQSSTSKERTDGHTKPADPKKAYHAALREKRMPPSAALFRKLAKTVSLRSCEDSAFGQLLATLREWFPQPQ